MKTRGFALGVVLSLLPVLTLMAWTFLEIGSVNRATALQAEARVRGLHAAEAGIRHYLATGQPSSFEMNECEVVVELVESNLVATARPIRRGHPVQIVLETEKGFVTSRRTNEKR